MRYVKQTAHEGARVNVVMHRGNIRPRQRIDAEREHQHAGRASWPRLAHDAAERA
ncbi:MAG: hypothetical protein ACM3N6_06075 [Betaproteobacteria bacterium]